MSRPRTRHLGDVEDRSRSHTGLVVLVGDADPWVALLLAQRGEYHQHGVRDQDARGQGQLAPRSAYQAALLRTGVIEAMIARMRSLAASDGTPSISPIFAGG